MSLSDRSLGWLRYLNRKAHTPDNWDRDGAPHPHWDNRSDPPTASWHRFDLVDSAYALGLFAHRTPAWTERYVKILDQLIERHTGWWSAADWLTQFGHDPARGDYPASYRSVIPTELWGNYDAPGWTANGIEPYGRQLDPIAAEGMAAYKGFLLVLLGIRSMIDRHDRWNQPFTLIREHSFAWTHSAIAEHLCNQWQAAPIGCHCENTKIWPQGLAGAGLGLRLHDNRHDTDYHDRAFTPWWDYARHHYLDLAGEGPPGHTSMYYDPVVDVHHRVPVQAALMTSFYAAPQVPNDARTLFAAACSAIGLDRSPALALPPSRDYGASLLLAREWGLSDLEGRLEAAIEACFEPTWDHASGEFTWAMGLNETHPRGQFNALLAAAEAGGFGRWEALSAAPLATCPQVVDVDFPLLAMRRAEWRGSGLYLDLAPLVETPHRFTTFRVVGVEPRQWDIAGIEGVTAEARPSGLIVRVPLVAGKLEFTPSSY